MKQVVILIVLSLNLALGQVSMTKSQKEEFLKDLVSSFESEYVWEEKGKVIAKALQYKIDNGDYSGLNEAEIFVETLNRDLFVLSNDRHLTIEVYNPKPEKPKETTDPVNKSLFKKELLAEGIYYLKFDVFPHLDQSVEEEIEEMFTSLKTPKVIIFDLRDNSGGSDKTVNYIAGYFFKEKTMLATSYQWNSSPKEIWALPKKLSESLSETKLMLLTSQATFSAAEIFAQRLQLHGKAKVIGEPTFGAAHRTASYLMNDVFMLHWPYEYSKHVKGDKDLEGVGIKPDYKVHYNSAKKMVLDIAQTGNFPNREKNFNFKPSKIARALLKAMNADTIDENFVLEHIVLEDQKKVLTTLNKFKMVWNPGKDAKITNIHHLEGNSIRIFLQTNYGIIQMKVILNQGKIGKIMYRL